uniref:DH domain-containing protein n=1 Tax=Romanomermis culicivorax TaxID=13658 RepID=A0A915KZ85_ROMCU
MDKLGNYCDPIWDDDGIVASTSALKMEEPEFETGDGKNFNRSKMNVIEKLDRIVHELVETETVFVKDLENLIRTYVQPLQVQLFLPPNDVNRLAASCASMLNFQKEFLEELQEASSPCSELEDDDGRAWSNRAGTRFPFRSAENLKYAILRISCVFCNAAAKFKKYSPYCAIYLHIQTVLKIDQNLVLQKFLHSLNIKREHSETFESYLIKPVQRILRYPLFLKEISSLCSSPAMMQALTKCQQQQRENNNQFYKYLLNKIKNACEKMEKVAEYINEMQRIYEQYGHLFDQAQCLYKSLR